MVDVLSGVTSNQIVSPSSTDTVIGLKSQIPPFLELSVTPAHTVFLKLPFVIFILEPTASFVPQISAELLYRFSCVISTLPPFGAVKPFETVNSVDQSPPGDIRYTPAETGVFWLSITLPFQLERLSSEESFSSFALLVSFTALFIDTSVPFSIVRFSLLPPDRQYAFQYLFAFVLVSRQSDARKTMLLSVGASKSTIGCSAENSAAAFSSSSASDIFSSFKTGSFISKEPSPLRNIPSAVFEIFVSSLSDSIAVTRVFSVSKLGFCKSFATVGKTVPASIPQQRTKLINLLFI